MKISSQTVKTDADQWRRLPSPGTNITRNDNSKDKSVVPHNLVEKTYARLNDIYAQNLIANWAEEAEPAKHVFEDLAIAAFIIELWRSLYGAVPKSKSSENSFPSDFPGFVDMACGNGVLVYVLLMEGYSGLGFDARRRNSWKTFPEPVQDRLMEKVFIPKPFIDVLEPEEIGVNPELGNYPKGTFLISNHADELTVWTPLIAALACPTSPLPFLAIPCCSHSLSGDKFRYPPSETGTQPLDQGDNSFQKKASIDQNPQPASGDLRALRLLKQKEKTEEGMFTSMYGSLTAKTMEIAQEVGYEVQRSKLQIPSTRDMGITGRQEENVANEELQEKSMQIIRRECENDGGIEVAARKWVERARNVHRGDEEGSTVHS
jgi:tRNASer (uridine44-2'-O)-methyltransferase